LYLFYHYCYHNYVVNKDFHYVKFKRFFVQFGLQFTLHRAYRQTLITAAM